METIFIAKGGKESHAYTTMQKAIKEAPKLFYGEGDYIVVTFEAPTDRSPFYYIDYRITNQKFPEGWYMAGIDIFVLSVDDNNNPQLSEEDINYIKGLQS